MQSWPRTFTDQLAFINVTYKQFTIITPSSLLLILSEWGPWSTKSAPLQLKEAPRIIWSRMSSYSICSFLIELVSIPRCLFFPPILVFILMHCQHLSTTFWIFEKLSMVCLQFARSTQLFLLNLAPLRIKMGETWTWSSSSSQIFAIGLCSPLI